MKAIIGRLLCKIGWKLGEWGNKLNPPTYTYQSSDKTVSYRAVSGVVYSQRLEDFYNFGDASGPNTIEYHSNNRAANRERSA